MKNIRSMKLNQDNKGTLPGHILTKLQKTNDNEKMLSLAKGKMTHYVQKDKDKKGVQSWHLKLCKEVMKDCV